MGDEFDIEGDEFSFTYSNHVTYLFTVGASYEIEISSDIDSNDGENWKLGTAYSTKKGPNGETTDEKVAEGITLTIYEGSDGGLFEVSVISKEDAGVGSLVAGSEKFVVYGLNGVHLFTTENKDDLSKLQKGIYIINGEKVSIK